MPVLGRWAFVVDLDGPAAEHFKVFQTSGSPIMMMIMIIVALSIYLGIFVIAHEKHESVLFISDAASTKPEDRS